MNYLDLCKSYCNASYLGFLGLGGWGRWGGCPGWSTVVYMSSGMFRGKESSNRIKLSQFWCFGLPVALGIWDGWMGVGSDWGVPTHMCTYTCIHTHTCTHTHMHTHAHTCMRGKHDNFMQMAAPIGGIPGNSLWCHMHMHVHACTYICMYVGASSLHPQPHPPTPPTPSGDPRNQSKFNSTWTNWDLSILFKDLKSVETSPPMGGCIIWWVGGCVDGWGQVKTLKILTESR